MTKPNDQIRAAASDPAEFRRVLLIDADAGPRPLGDAMDPWQRADFEALDPGWRRVAGHDVPVAKSRAWLERARGHSKTADIATMVTWALLASRRKLSGIVAAADRDQAGLIASAIDRLLRLNPWLAKVLEVQRDRVINRHSGSELVIISNDAPSSYGQTPDFIICDELTHWFRRDLWDSLLSSAAKRANCLLLIITNAGFQDSWQFDTREAIRGDTGWYFSRLEGPQASWLTADRLAEQQRLLPCIAYRRLWGNEWVSGSGDALDESTITAAFARDLPPQLTGDRQLSYAAGLDLSVSRDHSAFVIISKDAAGRYRLARRWIWKPPRGGKIDQAMIEQIILDANKAFRLRSVAADPFQAEGLVQRLQRAGVRIETRPQSGKALVEQAMMLVELFNAGNIDLPADDELERQLRKLRIEARSYGLRLVSDRSANEGHGDLVTALSIALVAAKPLTGGPGGFASIPLELLTCDIRKLPQYEAFQKAIQAANVQCQLGRLPDE